MRPVPPIGRRRGRRPRHCHHRSRRAAIPIGHDVLSPSPPIDLFADAALFLDFDGTLVDLADRPDGVVVDDGLRALLARLDGVLGGRLAIVSGRSIAQLDDLLGPIAADIALVGSHGAEHRSRAITDRPARPDSLVGAAERLRAFAACNPGVLVEEKSFGVALHYRASAHVEAAALALAETIAGEAELTVQNGKMRVEIRTPGSDKGGAVRRLMALAPMRGGVPVFVGDDRTDEHGFEAAVAMGGAGILVGPPRETSAHYRLDDPSAVRAWLKEAVA